MNLEAGVSVIICCYNSAPRISETLRHLARQDLSKDAKAEIIVVNNASSDDLERTAEETWSQCGSPLPLRIVVEHRAGLAYARMRGVQEAGYAYGVFCDDDNWLAADYLSRLCAVLRSDERIGVVGGCSVPATEAAIPPWFYTRCRSYAVGVQADATGDVTHRGYVWGAGMGFRMSLLRAMFDAGKEPLLTDRQGGQMSSGGDGELCSWYIFAGYRLWYDEGLMFRHFIPTSRLTKEYYQAMVAGFADSGKRWRAYRGYISLKYGLARRPHGNRLRVATTAKEKAKALLDVTASGAFIKQVIEYERFVKRVVADA